jgi:hypothetical protein
MARNTAHGSWIIPCLRLILVWGVHNIWRNFRNSQQAFNVIGSCIHNSKTAGYTTIVHWTVILLFLHTIGTSMIYPRTLHSRLFLLCLYTPLQYFPCSLRPRSNVPWIIGFVSSLKRHTAIVLCSLPSWIYWLFKFCFLFFLRKKSKDKICIYLFIYKEQTDTFILNA